MVSGKWIHTGESGNVIAFCTIKEPVFFTAPLLQATSNLSHQEYNHFYSLFISTRLIMDVKLMLVLTFTTIVVVAGSPAHPSRADIAAGPPWGYHDTKAEAQLRSRGDCNYITLKDGRRFCVALCVTSKEYT